MAKGKTKAIGKEMARVVGEALAKDKTRMVKLDLEKAKLVVVSPNGGVMVGMWGLPIAG